MSTKTSIEVYIVIDEEGQYGIGTDSDAARDNYEEAIGPLNECEGFRTIKTTIEVPLPVVASLSAVVEPMAEPSIVAAE